MKKNYIGIIALAICTTGFAQNGNVNNTIPLMQRANNGHVTQTSTSTPTQKGATLWSDDFATTTNWTIAKTGVNAHQWYQETNAASPAGLDDFASTTVGNGFMMVNSDANQSGDGNGTPIETTFTTTNPIDLTGQPYVVLEFQHQFRWWQDIREVRVSGDNGSTWTTFQVSDASGNLVGQMNQNTGNPEVTIFDISSVAGGQSQVLVQFYYYDQDFWGWYWMVDDVSIKVQDQYDIINNASRFGAFGLDYFSIPTTQVSPIDFYAVANSFGYGDQTNVIVTADVNSGTFTGTSAAQTVMAGAMDTLIVTTQYTPAASVGTHDITWTISSDQTDATPSDNVMMDSFDVTDFIYARDRGVYESQGGGEDNAAPGDFAFEAGNLFDIFADQAVYAVDVTVGPNTPSSTIVYGKIYQLDNSTGDFIYVDETEEYTVEPGDQLSMVLFNSPVLTAGNTYFACVGTYSEFYYGRSGTSDEQTSFILYGGAGGSGSQYYTTSTPMVSMNFDPSIGIKEVTENGVALGQNMPNPANGNTTINYTVASNSEVSMKIVDMTGKVVMNINDGIRTPGSYSIVVNTEELAGGMYFYTLSTEKESLTKSMTVVK